MTRPVVACVDPSTVMLAAMGRALASLNIEILATGTPSEALGWIATREIAVLVAEIDLQAMNGIELMARARQTQPEIARVLISANRTFEAALHAINDAGVFRYVTKPFEPAGLRTTVAAAIDHHHEQAQRNAAMRHAERRVHFIAELEAEHPGLHRVALAPDGTYIVPKVDPDALSHLNLCSLLSLRRQS